jgi:alpha-mannosidase
VDGGGFWGHDNATVAFPANVPGLGYAQYTVIETDEELEAKKPGAWHIGRVHHCPYSMWERSPEGLENDFLRLEVDPTTGGILRLVDRKSKSELVTPAQEAPALEYLVERPHDMTAWLVQHQGAAAEYPVLRELRRALKGPHKASIEVDLAIHESNFTLVYELRADDPKVYVDIKGVWFQRGTPQTGVPVLNYVLPLALEGAQGRYEIPFGAIDRTLDQREEVPALQWAEVTGKQGSQAAGCLLYNDSKHGHSLVGSTLRLTLIRSSYGPDILPEIGQHEVHLALQPFAGQLPVSAVIRAGDAFNHPIKVVSTDLHPGAMPKEGQFIRLEGDAVVLTTVKKAEDGQALVLRLFNPTATRATAKAFLDPALSGKITRTVELDLMERELGKSTAKAMGQTVRVSLPAHGIATVRVELRRK